MSLSDTALKPVEKSGGLYPNLYPVSYKRKRPTNPEVVKYKKQDSRFVKVESEMPFGEYKDHADCVAKNRDKDDPHAYCADIERTIKERRKQKAKGTTPDDTPEQMFKKEKEEHGLSNKLTTKLVKDHLREGVEGEDPSQLSLQELMEKERKAHPDMSDEELEELVKLHIRELGEPSNQEHKENYKKTHNASRIQFGVDSDYQFYNRFQVGSPNDTGDIPLTGTFLDFEATTNGWYIDPAEEENLVSDQGRVTFRVAHSKEPERVIGEYKRFWAAEDDGCVDAYGKPLNRHIDFEAVTNPADPQLRTNIMKGWVNDISPGLDAEVFCSKCGEAWGLDANNKLVKSCEHQDALGVLRNITKKEGSMVTEPAFEGRTQFRMPTFAMTMNKLFSPDENESEPVGSRLKGHATDDRRQTTKGDAKIMSNNSERKEGTDAALKKAKLLAQKYGDTVKELDKLYFKAEDEDEDKGEDQDEDARIRAAIPLLKKAKKNMEDYQKALGFLNPDQLKDVQGKSEDEDEDRMEDQHKYAEDKDEDRTEDAMPSTSPQKPGPGQLKGMNMTKEERAKVLEAEKIIAEDKKHALLSQADVVLARQERRAKMQVLEEAKKTFEAEKDSAGVKAVEEHLAKLKAEIEAESKPKSTTVTGAQVPDSTPKIVAKQPSNTVTPMALRAAFNAELAPAILANPRFVGLRFKEGPQ